MSWYSLSVKPMDEYTSAVIAGIARSISVAALLAVVLSPIGCGPRFNWEGTWTGNRNLPPKNGEDPIVLRTIGQVTVIIEGSQFKMKEGGMPFTGTVRHADGKAFLKVETRMNTPISKEPKEVQDAMKEIELTPREDGKIDFVDPGGLITEPLALEREVKKP